MAVTLAAGAPVTNDQFNLAVDLFAPDAVTYDLSGDLMAIVDGAAMVPSTTVALLGGDGLKRVFATFYDAAGNTAAVSDTVTLDTLAPAVISVSLASGASPVSQAVQPLAIGWNGDAFEMLITGAVVDHGIWEPVAGATSVTLNGGNGPRTVWVQVRDAAFNSSVPVSAFTMLDTVAPASPTMVTVGPLSTTEVMVSWAPVTDPDLNEYAIYYRLGTAGPPYPGTEAIEGVSPLLVAAPATSFVLSGFPAGTTVHVALVARDVAGNASAMSPDTSVTLPLFLAKLLDIQWGQASSVTSTWHWLSGEGFDSLPLPVTVVFASEFFDGSTDPVVWKTAATSVRVSDSMIRFQTAPLTPGYYDVGLLVGGKDFIGPATGSIEFVASVTTMGGALEAVTDTTSATDRIADIEAFIGGDFGDVVFLFVCNQATEPDRLYLVNGTVLEDRSTGMIPFDNLPCADAEIVDFDLDGDSDIFVGNSTGFQSYMLENTGMAFTQVTAPVIVSPVDDIGGVAAADLDGNGWPDLVITSTGTTTPTIVMYNFEGTYVAGVTGTDFPNEVSQTGRPAIGDVNGDGWPDIVLPQSVQSALWLNDGTGRFTDATATWMPNQGGATHTSAELADLDNDGDLDLVLAGSFSQTQIYINFNTAFSQSGAPAETGATRDISVGDVNGDGLPDVLLAQSGAPDLLWTATAPLSYSSTPVSSDTWGTQTALLFDIDRDNDLDLLLGENTGTAPLQLFMNGLRDVTDVTAQMVNAPTPRAWGVGGTIAYLDPVSGPIMLAFGGGTTTTAYADLYALRLTDLVWESRCTSGACLASAPSARRDAAGAVGFNGPELVVFGGEVTTDETTYVYHVSNDTWTSHLPGLRPSGRTSASLAWMDPADFWLFGGSLDGNPSAVTDELWYFTTTDYTWMPVGISCVPDVTCPSPRYRHASAAFGDFLFVFGGNDNVGPRSDIWMFDRTQLAWTPMAADCGALSPTCPGARVGSRLVGLPWRQQLVMFGDSQGTNDDVWVFDIPRGKWAPLCQNCALPPKIGVSWLTLDPTTFDLYSFGGIVNGTTATNQLWRFRYR